MEKTKLRDLVKTINGPDRMHYHGFVGKSPEMQAIYRIIDNAAQSRASVIIMGESGTGKEVAAKAIHSRSARKEHNFVALNCAAIPQELLESEIFGHVKGAFTGAVSDREGAAARADGGTLFFDELTEMPIALQSKLLRFIQEGVYTPVGSGKTCRADIRFICATNRNPFEAIRRGFLREDLYYRLSVIPVELPPLRERGDDIMLLAEHFLEKAATQEKKDFVWFDTDARDLLLKYRWPGNVRELQNVIQNAVIMNQGQSITAAMLSGLKSASAGRAAALQERADQSIRPLKEVERETIESAIRICGGNITEAARQLGLNPATIHRKQKSWEEEDSAVFA